MFTPPWPKHHGRLLRRPLISNHHSKPTLMRVFKPYKGYFWRQVAKLMPLLYQILLLVLWDSKSDNFLTKWLRTLQQEREVQTPELSMNLYKIGTFVHFYHRFLIVKALVGAFNKKGVPRRASFGQCETSRRFVGSFSLDPANTCLLRPGWWLHICGSQLRS